MSYQFQMFLPLSSCLITSVFLSDYFQVFSKQLYTALSGSAFIKARQRFHFEQHFC